MTRNTGGPQPGAGSVDHQAAVWATRVAHGAMTDEQRRELEAWLAADRRHRGAYLRAQAGLCLLESAVIQGPPVQSTQGLRPEVSRRRRWGFGLASAALAAAACMVPFLWVPSVREPGHPALPSAADRAVSLMDGSVVTLHGGARIEVALSGATRRITLVSGEASFKVAKDPTRPFVVRSGGVYAQATGTLYSVRRVGVQGGMVQVSEGSVLVWAGGAQDQAVLLHAGAALTLDPGAKSARAAPPLSDAAQISLDGVTIADAVERFNRVNHTQIIVADPRIGRVEIVGLFRASDPGKFAKAAALVAGAHVVQRDGNLILQQ